jgi:hypothetical protein
VAVVDSQRAGNPIGIPRLAPSPGYSFTVENRKRETSCLFAGAAACWQILVPAWQLWRPVRPAQHSGRAPAPPPNMATITNPMFGDATTGATLASAIGDGQVGDADDVDAAALAVFGEEEMEELQKEAAEEEKKRHERRAEEDKEVAEMEKKDALKEAKLLLGVMKTLDELGHQEQRRAGVVEHGKMASYWDTLTAWDGTAVKWACTTFRLWWTVGIFMTVRLVTIVGMLRAASGQTTSESAEEWIKHNIPPMDMGKVAIIGSFHSLFLVFYASQTYGRYDAQWKTATGMQGRIYDTCTMAINCFKQDAQGT